MTLRMTLRKTLRMTFKTWDFRGVYKEDFEGDFEVDFEWDSKGDFRGLQRGLQTGHGRGLAVNLRSGKVQVRSGSVFSSNLILLSLTLTLTTCSDYLAMVLIKESRRTTDIFRLSPLSYREWIKTLTHSHRANLTQPKVHGYF